MRSISSPSANAAESSSEKVDATKTKATVTFKLKKDDSEATIDADTVLVATGRRPYVDGLGLEALGVVAVELQFLRFVRRHLLESARAPGRRGLHGAGGVRRRRGGGAAVGAR